MRAGFLHLSSSGSGLGLARGGSLVSMSVLDFLHLSSSGSGLGLARSGSVVSMSVLDFLHLSSSGLGLLASYKDCFWNGDCHEEVVE